ncbi:mannitol dehydrogenase family protein [Marinomonas algicola]|uniref:mannitol dehydrogenase family protein n=1 Tax=Marinomonas algicola TaxID=2773454 RepID=UPI00174918EA|nr:mannitol dehydrogenase family protein [Marinomonas algicola]
MSDFLKIERNAERMSTQNYVRDDITAGVMHLGVGAFHRAHQAVFFDRLLALPAGKDWGLVGVNIRSQDRVGFSQLEKQKGEYVLKTMSADGRVEYEHIRSIVRLIDGSTVPNSVDELMSNPTIQLVTFTVTEGGYYLDENKQLMLDNHFIKEDIASGRNTLYAFLYAGLKLRSETSNSKVTLLSCDNLRHNGTLLKTGLIQFLQAKNDFALIDWVEENVSFPCSMVDRITPKPSHQHVDDVQARFGVADEMTVMGEDFIQWVIEDDFAGEKPLLNEVGVEFVSDVTPFEEAKIRILNAGHTVVTYQAALKQLTYFDEAMQDAQLKQYFTDFIKQDSIPAIGESIVDLPAYYDVIAQRFSNRNIGDTVERICTDGYAKFAIFVYPTLAEIYRLGGNPYKTIEGIASWFVFINKVAKGKLSITYNEPNIDKLSAFTDDEAGINAFVTDRFLWQKVPEEYPKFTQDLTNAIKNAL